MLTVVVVLRDPFREMGVRSLLRGV